MANHLPIRCYITCSADFWGGKEHDFRPAHILRSSCLASKSNRVELVDKPTDADVVLFAESHRDDAASGHFLEHVRRTPIYREFHSKTVVYSGRDIPFPTIPGIYPSLSTHWAKLVRGVGGPYIVDPNPFLEQDIGWNGNIRYLASFQGSCKGKPLRLRLLNISNSKIPVVDSGSEFVSAHRQNDKNKILSLKRDFVCQMLESKFVLCPSGAGISSFRLFEAMQLSRAPVIISDSWLAPPGPNWSEFAIFVPEQSLVELPKIIKSYEDEYQQRGNLARKAWERFYSPTQLGEHLILSAFQTINCSRTKKIYHEIFSRLLFLNPYLFCQGIRQRKTEISKIIKSSLFCSQN